MGILSRIVFYGAIAGAGAAFATKPSPNEVRELIRNRLAGQIEDGSIISANNSAAQAALAACQITPANCAALIESMVSLDYENRYLFASITSNVPGLSEESCIAAFDQLMLCR